MKAPQPVSFVQPLITRGEEIRAVDPVVSYFCFYSAVRQVLEAKLHTSNSEVAEFATELLNEIETMKANSKSPELLENDEASRAHVLNFAALVFTKAETSTHTHKVNKSTGAGFAAAAVFLGLESVWGELSSETLEKIKYAKFQATRILKAIKNGEDPNELYPKDSEPEEPDMEELGLEDGQLAEPPGDSELPNESELSPTSEAFDGPEQADNEQSDRALEREFAQSQAPELPQKENVEDLGDPESNDASVESEGIQNDDSIVQLPETPRADPGKDIPLPHAPKTNPENDLPLPPAPAEKPEGNKSPPATFKAPKNEAPKAQPKKVIATSKPSVPRTNGISVAKSAPSALRPEDIMSLTATSGSAQKHARYAISALNYDDIGTAVSELEQALQILKLYQDEHST